MANRERTVGISYMRQFDIFNPKEYAEPVTICGCGGIGSTLAVTLARLGIKDITLIDFDRVEPHNVPNQAFLPKHVGMPKVEAVAEQISALGAEPKTFDAPLEECRKEIRGVICSGLDGMPARYNLWQIVKRKRKAAYFDGRLGGQNIVLYGVDLRKKINKEAYEITLHPEAEAEPLPCTQRSIIDVAYLISATMARAIRKHLKDGEVEFVQFVDWENFSTNRITEASLFIESMKEKEK